MAPSGGSGASSVEIVYPDHWEADCGADGASAMVREIRAYSKEALALWAYFLESMPEDAELSRIFRVESREL